MKMPGNLFRFLDEMMKKESSHKIEADDAAIYIRTARLYNSILHGVAASLQSDGWDIFEKISGKKVQSEERSALLQLSLGKIIFGRPEEILKRFLSPDYNPPLEIDEKINELFIMGCCYFHLMKRAEENIFACPSLIMRLDLAALKLFSNVREGMVFTDHQVPETLRTNSSSKTRQEKAKVVFDEVIDAYQTLSKKISKWNTKSFSDPLKASYIQDYLLNEKGINRAAETIRKDISRAKIEGLI